MVVSLTPIDSYATRADVDALVNLVVRAGTAEAESIRGTINTRSAYPPGATITRPRTSDVPEETTR